MTDTPDPIVPKLPDWLSYSGAETYEDCPRKWRAKYVQKVADPSGPDAVVGTMVHDVLEWLARYPVAQRTPTMARAIAKGRWKERPTALRRRAWPQVVKAASDPAIVESDVLFTERKIRTVVGGVPTVGVIDRADLLDRGEVGITDYKSGKRPAPRFLMPKERQIRLYAAIVELTLGRVVRWGRLHWTATGIIDDVPTEPDDIARTVSWFAGVWDDIGWSVERDSFPPKPGPLCSWCPIVTACPEGRARVLERYDAGKRTGEYGMVVVEQRFTENLEQSVMVAQGRHLEVVPDSNS